MHFSALLLSFAAAVSAIDLRAHTLDGCNGGYVACTNINPNVCCTYNTRPRGSVAVVAIPTNWRIRARSFTEGGCSAFASEGTSNGNRSICLRYTTRGDRTGARYWFDNRKRAEDNTCPAEQPGSDKCESSVEPDVLGLEDGTEYNIAGLERAKVEEMIKLANSGANADAMPAEFQVLRRSLEA